MNYNFEEITFPSSDGKNQVYAEIYTPKNRSSVGIVQIAHGMIDHIGRYTDYVCVYSVIVRTVNLHIPSANIC